MIINYEQLKEIFGGHSQADLIARLSLANVKFLRGKRGRPFTTETALNQAMGLIERDLPLEEYRPDIQFG